MDKNESMYGSTALQTIQLCTEDWEDAIGMATNYVVLAFKWKRTCCNVKTTRNIVSGQHHELWEKLLDERQLGWKKYTFQCG